MKKLVLSVLTITMSAQMAFADGGERRARKEPLKIGEFLCALAGGTAAGVIVKNVGASDPITFIGALIGGTIGYKFCQYLNDDVAQGLQRAAWEGLNGNSCSPVKWSGGGYRGTMEVLSESWKIGGGGGDVSYNNTCKFFETTIFEGSKYIGRSRAWACNDAQDRWTVTDARWVSKKDVKSCRSVQLPDEGGSVSIGDGKIQGPTPLDINYVRGNWDLEKFRRVINDYGQDRNVKVAMRSDFKHEMIHGNLKAISDDGRAVIVYQSPAKPSQVFPINSVAINCRDESIRAGELGLRPICVDTNYQGDMEGTLQYVFRNGDIVINDANRGQKILYYSEGFRYRR